MFFPVLILCPFIFAIPTITSVKVTKRDTTTILQKKHDNLRENCSPRPGGGCTCIVKQGSGVETAENYDSYEQCMLDITVQTVHNKKNVNEEIKDRYGNYKEGCFPTPSGGCKCIERDAAGDEVVKKYNKTQCKIPQRIKRTANERPSQNVRDPVRERAQANYRAVINELNEKFKGLKEGCFPRPRGCLCVIGKDQDGRDITERRIKDRDCKCQPGEHGHGCPASGA
ncbi:unnamed protein product [Litomosoides sigmodontis]|uniref:Thyroglobulin type-1 domain-containing protein n=1 Tax=Litomosoides sigmodontis TaxID=42156 RepID=A0A3P6UD91_LITSI|nr:unnamed protein product [Litomosoides sigmodontis]